MLAAPLPRLFQFCVSAVAIVAALAASCAAADFHFTSVDEKLLQEANDLDAKIQKQGLVYDDPQAEAYITRIGAQLLAGTPSPEQATFRFRIIRDPMVNAFALPNGSIYVNTGLVAAVHSTMARSGGFRYSPAISRTFSDLGVTQPLRTMQNGLCGFVINFPGHHTRSRKHHD